MEATINNNKCSGCRHPLDIVSLSVGGITKDKYYC